MRQGNKDQLSLVRPLDQAASNQRSQATFENESNSVKQQAHQIYNHNYYRKEQDDRQEEGKCYPNE